MLPAPAYVISDAHLGFATRDLERSMLRFLKSLPGRAGSLLINGDLFEFWFEWKHVMPRRAYRVLAALADIKDSGVPVVMIAGNHDCWGGEILRQDVGVEYHLDGWSGVLGGWRTRVEHGDGLREHEDRRYRAMRSVFRSRLAIAGFRWVHPDVASAIANRTSNTSRTHTARDGGAGLREVAAERLAAPDAPELLIFGHTHVPELLRLGKGVYANAGAWMDQPTFLKITPERVELRTWTEGSDEGVRLNALDRVAEKALT